MHRKTRFKLVTSTVLGVAAATMSGVLASPASASGEVLAGTVRAAAGEAIAGATVTLMDSTCTRVVDILTTDADGEWGEFVALGSYKIAVAAAGLAPELYHDAVSCSAARAVTPGPVDIDVDLTAGARLSGTLRTSSGAPVPAGHYTVRVTTDRAQAYATATTTTSAYALDHLAAGSYRLTVMDGSGAAVGTGDVTLGAATATADVRTSVTVAPPPAPASTPTPTPTPVPTAPAVPTAPSAGGKVAVVVTDARGRTPVAGVVAQVKTGNTLLPGAATDAAGKIEVKGIAPGTVTVFLADGNAKRSGGAYPSTAVQVAVGSGTSYVAATLSRAAPS